MNEFITIAIKLSFKNTAFFLFSLLHADLKSIFQKQETEKNTLKN